MGGRSREQHGTGLRVGSDQSGATSDIRRSSTGVSFPPTLEQESLTGSDVSHRMRHSRKEPVTHSASGSGVKPKWQLRIKRRWNIYSCRNISQAKPPLRHLEAQLLTNDSFFGWKSKVLIIKATEFKCFLQGFVQMETKIQFKTFCCARLDS